MASFTVCIFHFYFQSFSFVICKCLTSSSDALHSSSTITWRDLTFQSSSSTLLRSFPSSHLKPDPTTSLSRLSSSDEMPPPVLSRLPREMGSGKALIRTPSSFLSLSLTRTLQFLGGGNFCRLNSPGFFITFLLLLWLFISVLQDVLHKG